MKLDLETFSWFKNGFADNNPIPETLTNIKHKLANYSIDIIIDVECKDVQFLIPKLINPLYLCDNSNYKIKQIGMKKLPIKMDCDQNLIEKVPTIIFKSNNIEQFRITEQTFNCSRIEKDIEYLLVTMITNNHPKVKLK